MLTYLNRIRGLSKELSLIDSQQVRRLLCGLPFGVLSGLMALPLGLYYAIPVFLAVWLATFGAFTVGHGPQMDLAKTDESTERTNIWDKLFGREGFWSEFAGLTASGLLVAIPTSVALAFLGHYLASVSFLVVPGMGKAFAYWVAQKLRVKIPALWSNGPDELGRNTDAGEILWGFVMDIGLLFTIIMLLLGIYS